MLEHEEYMREALLLAQEAFSAGEVPVGCIVMDSRGDIVGVGRNRREEDMDAVAHAEIEAIRQACNNLGTWRLTGCSLYVTLEPCPMCAGAIINARISRLFYGAKDSATGSCGSVINLFMERYGHQPEIVGGILEKECGELLSEFFRKLR